VPALRILLDYDARFPRFEVAEGVTVRLLLEHGALAHELQREAARWFAWRRPAWCRLFPATLAGLREVLVRALTDGTTRGSYALTMVAVSDLHRLGGCSRPEDPEVARRLTHPDLVRRARQSSRH